MHVQALGAEASVEGFDKGVVGRLAGPAEVERDAVGVGPQIEIARDELCTLIDTDRFWISNPARVRSSV
jgi:hypothetical protein